MIELWPTCQVLHTAILQTSILVVSSSHYVPLICKPLVEVAVRSFLFPDSKFVKVKYPFLSLFPLIQTCLFSSLSKGSWITSFLPGLTLRTSFVEGISIIKADVRWDLIIQFWLIVSLSLFLMVVPSCFQSCWPVS